jgi:FtsP/CotA-like multicopper oxidase with cupredoxin domain
MKFLRNTVVAAFAAAALGACAPAAEQAKLGVPESQTTLIVKNNNWQEVVIYMLRGSARARLGSVVGMGTARFRISDTMVSRAGDVRIMADPIGSTRAYTSPVIDVVPGSEVELLVQNNIATSNYSVYR